MLKHLIWLVILAICAGIDINGIKEERTVFGVSALIVAIIAIAFQVVQLIPYLL